MVSLNLNLSVLLALGSVSAFFWSVQYFQKPVAYSGSTFFTYQTACSQMSFKYVQCIRSNNVNFFTEGREMLSLRQA